MKLLPALFTFIIIILSGHFSQAQEVFSPASRSQSLGGISACLEDSWSVFGNQAGIAKIKLPIFAGTYQNRFLIKELSTRAAFFILPIQSSIFALSVYQFGETTFRQEKYGITYARSLTSKLHFGLQFNYYRFYLAEENQNAGSPGIELGFQYQLSRMVLLGIHTLNPYKTGFKTFSGKYEYASILNIGTYIEISPAFGFFTELEKQLLLPLNIKTGMEYNILTRLHLRTGFSGKPNQLSAGMGFEVSKLKIDLAVAYNQHLGNSPSASFQYQF